MVLCQRPCLEAPANLKERDSYSGSTRETEKGTCMELSERCMHLCRHIETLTGIHTTLLDVEERSFLREPFHIGCSACNCDAYTTHLYGTYEAERWGMKYIYYCPRGLVFIAATPAGEWESIRYSLIVGPVMMTNDTDDLFEDPMGQAETLQPVPKLTTAQTHSLCEMIAAAVASFSLAEAPPDVDSGSQAAMLQMMYDLTGKEGSSYPIEKERLLQEHIRVGDKEAAQNLLNELLVHLYSASENNLEEIKTRMRELLVLMSRAAIDGGADMDEIFSLCRRYDQEAGSMDGIEKLNRWIGLILHKFVSFVFDFSDIKHRNTIYKTTAYIKEHLAEKLSLNQVVEQAYLSKSYFCRVIKSELGCTFTEYVNRLRIEKAKELLSNTALPIAEVAYSVGFDDQSYFTRIFKKNVGTAPCKYREVRFKNKK